MENSCKGCVFFMPAVEEIVGFCRRFPAQWTNDARGWDFPAMKAEGWCGEFKTKERTN